MKKQQRSSANCKDSEKGVCSKNKKANDQNQEKMASNVVKKYDDLIRCTNVLTEGIESGEFQLYSYLMF